MTQVKEALLECAKYHDGLAAIHESFSVTKKNKNPKSAFRHKVNMKKHRRWAEILRNPRMRFCYWAA